MQSIRAHYTTHVTNDLKNSRVLDLFEDTTRVIQVDRNADLWKPSFFYFMTICQSAAGGRYHQLWIGPEMGRPCRHNTPLFIPNGQRKS